MFVIIVKHTCVCIYIYVYIWDIYVDRKFSSRHVSLNTTDKIVYLVCFFY